DEHFLLGGQVGTAGLHQRDHRQSVLKCDLVGPQYLPQCPRITGATLDGGVVGDEKTLDAADRSDADDEARADLELAAPSPQWILLEEPRIPIHAPREF